MTQSNQNDAASVKQRSIRDDSAGALAALRRASIKARLRALDVTGSVPMWRDGKVVYETDPKVLFPDGTDPDALQG